MKSIIKKGNCTGCFSCMNICPANAIYEEFDNNGFRVPRIDNDKCINCNSCVKVCPVNNLKTTNRKSNPYCYAIQASDELRMKSSSGGLFGIFANVVLKNKGVVFGVKFDDSLNAVYAMAEKYEEVDSFRGSKYIEAKIGYIYKKVKELLEDNRMVLFSGCPCHIAGLKSFLGKKYDKLITIDLICHSITPAPLFSKYVEGLGIKSINRIEFRNKQFGWNTKNIVFYYKNSKFVSYDDIYLKGFTNGIMMRKSCMDCKFASFPRQGDITIGDFWNINDIAHIYKNDGKGVSLALVNSAKGNKIFDFALKYAEKCVEVPFNIICNSNRFYEKHHTSYLRNRFFSLIQKGKDISEAIDNTISGKHDIVLFGNWSGYNYGAHLTHLALYKKLSLLGYSVLMCEKMDMEPFRPLSKPELFKYKHYPTYDLLKPIASEEELAKLNELGDVFILGSDQLFNWNYFGHAWKVFLLEMISNDKKRISYATSFGDISVDEIIPLPIKRRLDKALLKFDSVFVREAYDVDILHSIGVDSKVALDPVFLLSNDEWKKIARIVENNSVKYIFCYLLNLPENIEDIINDYALSNGLKVIYIHSPLSNDFNQRKGEKITCEEWLSFIANSVYVITDSYHAVAFSIIMNKEFTAFRCPRIDDLLERLDLSERIFDNDISDIWSILTKKINYKKVNQILTDLVDGSINNLITAIKSSNITD